MKSGSEIEVACLLCGQVRAKPRQIRSHIGGFPISIVECPQCGLAFQHPQPSQEEGTRYFDWRYKTSTGDKSKVDQYLSDREFATQIGQARIKWIRSIADGHRLLDIGSGNGALIYAAHKAGFEATGLDLSQQAVSKAKEMFGIDIICTDIVDFTGNGPYDIVTAFAVIEHVRDPFAILRAAYKHITPGGTIIIETMNYNSMPRLLLGKRWYFFLFDHLYYYSPQTLKIFLERSGFENIHVHAVPPSADITLSENYPKLTGALSKWARKIRFAVCHPLIALRYPLILGTAKKMWPQDWKREILLMTARKAE